MFNKLPSGYQNQDCMHMILLLLMVFGIISCGNSEQPSADEVAKMLTGEWRIEDFEWSSKSQLSPAEMEAFQQAAQLQKRRFREYSNFEFNADKTYRMDFTGRGGDFGTWSITKDIKLANLSERYQIPDTVLIDYYSPDTFKLTIIDTLQEAKVMIVRRK
jgi:hypothetical protein